MITFNVYALLNGISGINFISIAIYCLLNKKKRSNRTTIFLSLFCVFLSLNFLYDILNINEVYGPKLMYLDEFALLMAFPSLYFYVLRLTSNKLKFNWQYLLHGLPIVLFLFLWVFAPAGFKSWNRTGLMEVLYGQFNRLQFLFYIIAIFKLLKRNNQIAAELISGADNRQLLWIKRLLFFLFLLFVIWVLDAEEMVSGHLINVMILAFSYWLGYHAMMQQDIYVNLPTDFSMESVAPGNNRYKNSKLTATDKKIYVAQIKALMEKEKPYLNNELTLTSLADRLDMKPIYLSQVLNEEFEENFYAFINRYRIEESKRLLKDKRYEHYSVYGIAIEAGFNSKSTFNKAFKELTGISPSGYQKSN